MRDEAEKWNPAIAGEFVAGTHRCVRPPHVQQDTVGRAVVRE